MPTNERAQRGARLLKIYGLYAGSRAAEPDDALRHLLCDLLIWSWRDGVNFPLTLRAAIQMRNSEHIEETLPWTGD